MKKTGLTAKLLTGLLSLSLLSAGALTALPQIQSEGNVVCAATGDRVKADNICFEETQIGSYKINSYRLSENSPAVIEIPDKYEGKEVTGLSFDMFDAEEGYSLNDDQYDLRLGKNIRDIESYAFRGINIRSIEVNPDNQYYAVYDGMLCTKDGKTLIYCPNVMSGKVTVPETVVRISQGALIGSNAENIVFGANVRYVPSDITEACPHLKSYSVSSENKYFSVRKGVLLNKSQTTLFSFPVEKEGAYAVPKTVYEIKSKAFSGAALLTKVYLKNTHIIGDQAFYGCTGLKSITIPDSVERIGDSAFANCSGISFAVFPDSLAAIPYGLFSGCRSLKRFNIPASLESVGCRAFEDTKWYDSLGEGFVYIGDKVLYGYNDKEPSGEKMLLKALSDVEASEEKILDIREGTVSVTDFALSGSDVVKVNIPASLKKLGTFSLYPRDTVNEFAVSPDNTSFTVSDGILFSKDMTKLIAVPQVYKSSKYTVSKNVKKICGSAFSFNKNITDISVPESVSSFEQNPFNNGSSERRVFCIKGSAAEKAAIGDGVNVVIETPQLTVSKTEVTLGVGETYQLTARLNPDYTSSTLRWKTSNSGIVSVENGRLTAKKAGKAVITAVGSSGGLAKCTVTVKNAPKEITFSKSALTLGVNEKFTLYTTLDSGSAASGRSYTSSDESVVSIDKSKWNCCLTALKPGTAVITAKLYNGLTAKCSITVKNAPEKVEMAESNVTIGVGETVVIGSKLNDGSASTYRVYESSDHNVAEINPTSWNCSFTGISVGTAKIKVTTYNGKTGICNVTVKSPPRAVRLSKSAITLGVGETMKLTSTLLDGDYSRSVYFTNNNGSVVSILKNGRECEFKALKEGTATLTVHTYNGQTAKCKVTVKPSPEKIYLNRGLIVMKVGDTETISSYLDSGYASANRTYRTSNSKVVEMLSAYWVGKIKAAAPGTAYVTVRTQTGVERSCKIIVEE